ncbi:MAG: helix-turn-helix transcriptional regulator [Acidobacteria bacterium]|nr:helix-turn-helix transcriptional regulator [Acidobacteriota bacterium]
MLRREGDGCPVTGALQLVGDKWTLMIVRELARGSRRTTDLVARLHPISSRTLMARLKDMEHDELIERYELSASPPHVEYALTARGRLMLPVVEALYELGARLGCGDCEERRERVGEYCDACPLRRDQDRARAANDGAQPRATRRERERDDSIVLL